MTKREQEGEMKRRVSFNINDNVYVKLADKGRKQIQAHYNTLYAGWGEQAPPFPLPEEDENGYSKWQMWSLLEAFGVDFHIGMNPGPFDNEIFFEQEEIKP